VVKIEDYGLRLYDRQIPVKGPASAIILIKKFENIIDFTDIIEELGKELERRVQISIIDSENSAVYYVAKFVSWPQTKLKDDAQSSVDDVNMKELIDKGLSELEERAWIFFFPLNSISESAVIKFRFSETFWAPWKPLNT